MTEMEGDLKERIVINNNITAPGYYFKEALDVAEASEYTGLSSGTLYALAHERRMPFYKPLGKRIYFKRSELDGFMFRNKQLADYEASEAADAILKGERNQRRPSGREGGKNGKLRVVQGD
jgi:excisionase family DNA binding protein